MHTGLASKEFYGVTGCTFRAALHSDLKEMGVRDTHGALNTCVGPSQTRTASPWLIIRSATEGDVSMSKLPLRPFEDARRLPQKQ